MSHESQPDYNLEWEVEQTFTEIVGEQNIRQRIRMASFVLSDVALDVEQKSSEASLFQIVQLFGIYPVFIPGEYAEGPTKKQVEPSPDELRLAQEALKSSLVTVQQTYGLKDRHLKKALRMSRHLSGKSPLA